METIGHKALVLVLTLLLMLTACTDNRQDGTDGQGGPDTLYTEAKAMSIHLTEPERAMTMIDSAVIVGNINRQRGQYLKAVTQYGGLQNFALSRQTCLDLLDDSNPQSIVANLNNRNDSDDLLCVYGLLAAIESTSDNNAALLRYATEGSRLAHALNRPNEVGRMEGYIARVMAATGNTDEGISHLQAILGELRKDDNFNAVMAYFNTAKTLLHILLDHKRLAEMVPVCEQMLERIGEFAQHPDRFALTPEGFNPTEFEDYACGQTLAFLTTSYARQYTAAEGGELTPALRAELLRKARQTEAKMQQTRWSHTIDCDRMMTAAYHHLGQFQQFDGAMARLDSIQTGDTINYNFMTRLGLRSTAAQMRGRLAEAIGYLNRSIIIQDSINRRTQRDQLNELATVYHLQEERFAHQQAVADAHQMKLYALFIGAALIAALVVAVYFFYKRRQTMEKNRVLAREITEAIRYKELWEEAQKAPEAPLSSPEGDTIAPTLYSKTIEAPSGAVGGAGTSGALGTYAVGEVALYQQLRDVILRERLYLDPRLDRQMLVDRFGLSKERIGAAFAKGSPFKSLIDFLTDCRLPYAAKLLSEHPELSVADVALASGFPSADTFGRNFKQRYALTPSQFRENNLK